MNFSQASSEFRSPGISVAERPSYGGESLRDSHSFQQRPWADLAIISTLVGVCYWLVWPVGEYAILDDWAFNKSLSFLNERGELRILHWNPMSLAGHVLWGWLFTKLFGATFTVTKLSVVVLHVVELLVVVRWLRWCGVPSRGVWLAVLALMFHPLHFLHCYTYDTDIPAITWQLLGLFCLARGLASSVPIHWQRVCEQADLQASWVVSVPPFSTDTGITGGLTLPRSPMDSHTRNQNVRAGNGRDLCWLLLGSALIGWSAWTRQHGLVAWLAVVSYLVVCDRRLLLRREGWCALLPGAALLVGVWCWYQLHHGPTDVFRISMQQTHDFTRDPPWSSLPEIGMTYAVYLGSFVAALAVALPLPEWQRIGRRGVTLGLMALWLMSNLIGYFYFERSLLFPYMRNVITPFGLFAPNTYLLGSAEVRWGPPLAWVITVLSVLGSIALLQRFSETEWQPRERPRWVTIRLCSLWLVWQLAYIIGTTPLLFDRHLLILAPSSVLLFVLLTPRETHWRLVPFAAVVLPLAYYSLAGSHDIHAESRLAFQAGRDLMGQGIPPEKINGGYAFDGWHLYGTHAGPVPVRPLPPWWNYRIWAHLNSLDRTSDALLNSPESAWWSGPVRPPGKVDYIITLSSPKIVRQKIGPLSGGLLSGELYGGVRPDNRQKFDETRSYPFVSGWRGRTKFVYVLQRIPDDLTTDSAPSGEPP